MAPAYAGKRHAETLDARVARLARAQYGVFSRAQAEALGATNGSIDRRIATGRWERVTRGVYGITGVPPSWRRSLKAASLAYGGAPVSHRAAAALWQLVGFTPGILELTTERPARPRAHITVHRHALQRAEIQVLDAIPVTTPARTLLDVAPFCSTELFEDAMDDALRRRLVSISRLRATLERHARSGRPGVAAMRVAVDVRDPKTARTESVLEDRLARLLRRAGLPPPVRQHRVRVRGGTVAVVDFAYPDRQLAIEAQGYRWHSSRSRWEHDQRRLNDLTLLGWRVIHVTWSDVHTRPTDVVAAIRSALHDVR